LCVVVTGRTVALQIFKEGRCTSYVRAFAIPAVLTVAVTALAWPGPAAAQSTTPSLRHGGHPCGDEESPDDVLGSSQALLAEG
jgi:hypothetical protein